MSLYATAPEIAPITITPYKRPADARGAAARLQRTSLIFRHPAPRAVDPHARYSDFLRAHQV